MKAYLILRSLCTDGSAGCDAVCMKNALADMGIETSVFAARMSVEDAYGRGVLPPEAFPETSDDDIIFFIDKDGSPLGEKAAELRGRKILVYHDRICPERKREYGLDAYEELRSIYLSTARSIDIYDGAMVFSEKGERELRIMGCKCPIERRSLMLSPELMSGGGRGEPSSELLPEETVNILYSGMAVPDESIEDIIRAYACYRKYYSRNSQLIIGYNEYRSRKYIYELKRYTEILGCGGVRFLYLSGDSRRGAIERADAVICSPLGNVFPEAAARAVFTGVPVIMTGRGADRQLLGDCAAVTGDSDPHTAAALINRLVTDSGFRELYVSEQRKYGDRADPKITSAAFGKSLEALLGRCGERV